MTIRCLLVDDSPAFLAAASALLIAQGMEIVATARDAAEAERLVEEVEPDVALVDIELGEDDGIELAHRLAPRTPVVLISTHERPELDDLIASSPAAGFLPKTGLAANAISELIR